MILALVEVDIHAFVRPIVNETHESLSLSLSAKRPTILRSMMATRDHRSTRMIFDIHLIKANELMFSVECGRTFDVNAKEVYERR